MTDVTFATARLIGEPLQPSHLGEIVRMHRDPMVMATLGGLRDETSSQEYLDFNLSHWRRYGFGLWIVRDRADERVAGRAVLRHLDVDGVDEVELGYGFYPGWWGRGLATEAARELVRLGFQTLKLSSLVAVTQETNVASQRVLEKAGLSRDRIFEHGGSPHLLYRIQAGAIHR
jgi:RimJ/RimL family protein N-acetyltransferase